MTALATLALIIWSVLLFARGRFWRVAPDMLPALPPTEDGANNGNEAILAIVPARDETGVLPVTLPSLLSQETGRPFHVLLVDDHSTDGTAALARRLAAECGHAERLTVVTAEPLAPGWTGKLWAMRCGLAHAEAMDHPATRVLFTDADIAYAPGALARLAAEAERRRAVLASLMVKLNASSTAERWLIPPFVYFFRMLYPFAWVADPARRTAAAAGGSMLVDRRALAAAGGLGKIRDALIDDVALGRLLKPHGPLWLGLTDDVTSVRSYPRVADIEAMVVRSAYAELRYSPFRLMVALLGLALVFLVPPTAAHAGDDFGRLAGLLGLAAMVVSFAPMARFYGLGIWRGIALPVVAALYGLFTLKSALAHRHGRGGLWKGRVQAAASSSAPSSSAPATADEAAKS